MTDDTTLKTVAIHWTSVPFHGG
jgi:hypothetical protein